MLLYKKSIVTSLVLAGAMALTPAAHAAPPGVYYGVGIGQGDDQILNQTQAAAKLFAGYNVNRFLGMELSYVNLGSNYIDYYGTSFTQDGVSFDLVGYLPVSPYLDLFGKVGMYNWTVSDNYYYASSQGTDSDYGFGVSTQVSRYTWLRAEYQKFQNVAGGDVNLASVSLSFHF